MDEFVSLVVAYAKQETVDPIKSLGRFIGLGIAGALLFAVGGGLAALAAIRAVQAETSRHLTGSLTWTPYFAAFIIGAVGVAMALIGINRATHRNTSKSTGGRPR